MTRDRPLEFDAGRRAKVVELEASDELGTALRVLGVATGRPVVVVVGGAAGMGDDAHERAGVALRDAVVPVCEDLDAALIDGGTAAGIMQIVGEACAARHTAFPLIGVAAVGTVRLPDDVVTDDGRADLEPNHSHFVLVPGTEWGDESPWIVRVARAVAGESPFVGLVVGGGDITAIDARLLVDSGFAVIAISGTGGVADDLAAARHTDTSAFPVEVVDWRATDALRTVLHRALTMPV